MVAGLELLPAVEVELAVGLLPADLCAGNDCSVVGPRLGSGKRGGGEARPIGPPMLKPGRGRTGTSDARSARR